MKLQALTGRVPTLLLIFLLTITTGFSISCAKAVADDEAESAETEDSATDEETSDAEEPKDKESEKSDDNPSHEEKSEDSGTKDSGKDHDKDGKSTTSKSDKHGAEPPRETGDVTKIWAELMDGNKRFVLGQHSNGQLISSRKSLVGGQKPDVIVISCSDSRVPPELVFDKNLGELFVIRTAGNIADPIALGSIEYAAEHLHSKMLIVLGHETCGAVAATLSGDKMPTSNLKAIVNTIRPAFKDVDECKPGSKGSDTCVKLNVTNSARDIVAKSPILKRLVADGSLHVVKAIYQMESGKVVRF